jgi:uncharacterized membrane protein
MKNTGINTKNVILFIVSVLLICAPLILVLSSLYKGIHDSVSNILFSIAYTGLGLMLIVITFKVLETIYSFNCFNIPSQIF